MNTMTKKFYTAILIVASVCVYNLSYALPFIVVPRAGTTLPASVSSAGSARAFYTVVNNTSLTLPNNFVKYLPPNVKQVTSGGTYGDYTCGTTFTLAPKGQPGSSCSLELTVTGPVNANDPDPHHHLFVCAQDTTSCAGTQQSLNVRVKTNQYLYTVNFDNSLTICSLNAGGNITTCTNSTDPTFNGPNAIAINPAGTNLYITNFNSNTVSLCPLVSNGAAIGPCTALDASGTLGGPDGIVISRAGDYAYITNFNNVFLTSNLTICPINSNGTFKACSIYNGSGVFNILQGVALNPNNNILYLLFTPNGAIGYCLLNTANGMPIYCTYDAPGFSFPLGISFNAEGTVGYVADSGSSVFVCPVDPLSGHLINCTNSTGGGTFDFNNNNTQVGIDMHSNLNIGYAPNPGNNTLSLCPLDASGNINNCTVSTASGTLSQPSALLVD